MNSSRFAGELGAPIYYITGYASDADQIRAGF
jgi:hypothetical protein